MILDQSVIFGMADLHDRHDRHRDMRLDVDNMSYEVNDGKRSPGLSDFYCIPRKIVILISNLVNSQELLALEDRIGYVSTGLSEETITNHLKQRKHLSVAIGAQQEIEPCCICQVQIFLFLFYFFSSYKQYNFIQ